MTQALDQSIAELLRASQRDEQTLAYPLHDEIFGFHAQQAAEKLMKALIAGHAKRYQRTHDLGELHVELQGLGETLPPGVDQLLSLSTFAGIWRYQDATPISPAERTRILDHIIALRTHVHTRLAALRPERGWQ